MIKKDNSPSQENFTLADLEKYLDSNSESIPSCDEKDLAEESLLVDKQHAENSEKTNKAIKELMMRFAETSKENEYLKLQLEENNMSGDSKMQIGKRYKRENIILRHEILKLNEEINTLDKSHHNMCEELKKTKLENIKLKRVTKYVLDELFEEFGSSEYQGDTLNFIVSMFSKIKKTLIDTQEAYLKQKNIIKRLKLENETLQNENYCNIDLILKMNSKQGSQRNPLYTSSPNFYNKIKGKEANHKKHFKTFSSSNAKEDFQNDSFQDESYSTFKLDG